MASLEADTLVVFYYFGASEIWSDKMGGLIREGLLYLQNTSMTQIISLFIIQ